MTSERPALVPCPFCGDDMDSFAGMTKDAFVTGLNSFAIGCDCGAIGPMGTTMSEAVNAWNNRQAPVAQIERLRAALRELHAVVWGECPSLLNEDSGGDASLDLRIRELIDQTADA